MNNFEDFVGIKHVEGLNMLAKKMFADVWMNHHQPQIFKLRINNLHVGGFQMINGNSDVTKDSLQAPMLICRSCGTPV